IKRRHPDSRIALHHLPDRIEVNELSPPVRDTFDLCGNADKRPRVSGYARRYRILPHPACKFRRRRKVLADRSACRINPDSPSATPSGFYRCTSVPDPSSSGSLFPSDIIAFSQMDVVAVPSDGLVGIEGGVVSGVINLESPGVGAPGRRPRYD